MLQVLSMFCDILSFAMDSSSREEFLEDVNEPPDPDVVETDPTGRYVRYEEVLGKGACKTVYKGFDDTNGIEVAWCQVNIDAAVNDFTRDVENKLYAEVNLLKTVHHKHIIKMYTSWVDNEKKTLNIITELFNSGSVRQYRIKHKKVDMKAVKGWARQILRGLAYLHSQEPLIIHRDVKCDNIFINGNQGEVKIGDFGLATVMERASSKSVLGTPEFMAPEIYTEDYNELVDIYSFGMCMLEMMTNECPYSECRNAAQIFKKVLIDKKMPESLSKVKDPEAKEFIERCLGPADERLPAEELLKDPFLLPKDNGAAGNCSPKQLSTGKEIPLQKTESCTEQHMLTEHQITITAVGSHPVPNLEIQRVGNGKEFKLKGEKQDANSVSFKLKIPKEGGKVEVVNFPFSIEDDTSTSTASDMMELELPELSALFVAELIDVSMKILIPDWKPCVTIDHLIVTHQSAASISDSPPGANDVTIAETPGIKKLDGVVIHDNSGARHKDTTEDRDSGTFIEENCINPMLADSGFMVYNGCIRDVCANSSTNNVSTEDNRKDTFENEAMSLELEKIENKAMSLELKKIELEYRQALVAISKKRDDAIMEVKNRWSSEKKIVPVN